LKPRSIISIATDTSDGAIGRSTAFYGFVRQGDMKRVELNLDGIEQKVFVSMK
jgi:hypothetical protein